MRLATVMLPGHLVAPLTGSIRYSRLLNGPVRELERDAADAGACTRSQERRPRRPLRTSTGQCRLPRRLTLWKPRPILIA